MKRLLFGLSIFSFSFLFYSCEKLVPEPEMPPITSNGAGTLGYYLNGKIQYSIDDSECNRCEKPTAGIDMELSHCDRYYIFIEGNVYPSKSITFSLNVPVIDTGLYELTANDINCDNISAQYNDYNDNGTRFLTDEQYGGYIHISHLDQSLDFISGTFAFTAKNEVNEDTIAITDGRFDIPLTVW